MLIVDSVVVTLDMDKPATLLDDAGVVELTVVELDTVRPAALLDDGTSTGEEAGLVAVTGVEEVSVSIVAGADDTGVTATEELEAVNPATELVVATYVVVDVRTGQLVTDSAQLVMVKTSVVKIVGSGSEYVGVASVTVLTVNIGMET